MRSRSSSVLLLGTLMISGCDEAKPETAPAADASPPKARELPDDRLWTSTHFRYHTRANDDSVCEPLLEHLERHFDALQEYLGFTWPEGKHLDYHKYESEADKRANSACSAFNSSCFYADVGVQTAEPVELHELVHAYLEPMGRSHVALEEGLANALSCGFEVRQRPTPAAVGDVFTSGGWATPTLGEYNNLYHSATWFVGWLLDEYGPDRFMSWYAEAKGEHDLAAHAKLFHDLYDLALDDAWQVAFDSDDPDTACARVFECATPPWRQSMGDSCEWPLSVGSLLVQEPSWVVQRGSGFGLSVGACDGTPKVPHREWLRAATDGQNGEVFAVALPAGRYFVGQNPRFEEGSVQLFNQAVGLSEPNACPDLLPLTLDFKRNLTIALATGGAAEFTRVVSWREDDDTSRGYSVQCDEGVDVKWCSDCGECTATCDKDVMAADASARSNTRMLQFTSHGEGAHWVRLKRTY